MICYIFFSSTLKTLKCENWPDILFNGGAFQTALNFIPYHQLYYFYERFLWERDIFMKTNFNEIWYFYDQSTTYAFKFAPLKNFGQYWTFYGRDFQKHITVSDTIGYLMCLWDIKKCMGAYRFKKEFLIKWRQIESMEKIGKS